VTLITPLLVSEEQLRRMMPTAGSRLDAHWPYINEALAEGRIDTPRRITTFLAQLAHESAEYRYMEEIWGPTEAQLGYEGRADLGNTQPGDGRKFAGVGPIQNTGRANITACGLYLGIDTAADPKLLTLPQYGTRSAVWFWNTRKLSLLADRDWFKTITRIINGGLNGFSDRRMYWDRNRALLGLPLVDTGQEGADIMAFQRSRGLTADGVVGPKTMLALAA